MKNYQNVKVTPAKTYTSYANAEKAAVNAIPEDNVNFLRFMITCTPEGRFYPIFMGQNSAQEGMHFHFNCIA